MSNDNEKVVPITPKAEALRGLPPEWREKLIEQAAHMGVRSDHDTAWLLIGAFVNAWAAAAAAGEAATATQKATVAIPDLVYKGAVAAGQDLRGQVEAAGKSVVEAATDQAAKVQEGMVAAVQGAAQAGAGTLAKAVQGMDANAKARIEEIIARGVHEVAAAVRADARAAVAGRMARSWGVVASLLLLFLLLGGGLAWGGLYATHHITPWNMEIATNNQGHRLCGHLRGSAAEACLVRQQ